MRNVALITGGTRGIGLGIARALADAGFDLTIAGRRSEAAVSEVLEELRATGCDVLYVQADVSETADRVRLLEAAKERFGRLHVLVNNAGVAPEERRDILEATEQSFESVLRVNLQGPYFLTQQVATWMIEQQMEAPDERFVIINVGSISATFVSTNRGEYCVSKAGIAMATQLWAARLAPYDICVYELRPGIVDTDMTAPAREKYDRLFAEGLAPQSRWGSVDDVGRAAAALACGSFAYSTGQVVMIDGGMSIPRL